MEDCIEFKGYKNKGGYGQERSAGKVRLAHRIAYCKAKNIDIKQIDGLVVMHTCDNPPCVNPEHLRLGTQQENVDDMMKKGRHDFGGLVGEEHGKAKLTSEDVLRIREMVKFKSQTEVARLFLICQPHVSDIVLRRRWAHLPEQQDIGGGEK
jgi:predicted XRE-type DNA-binding protein